MAIGATVDEADVRRFLSDMEAESITTQLAELESFCRRRRNFLTERAEMLIKEEKAMLEGRLNIIFNARRYTSRTGGNGEVH